MQTRILVVDDELSIRRVLKAQLERDGHAVECAADGAEAISLLGVVPFDLIISDLRMPGVDGLALLEHVRARHPGLPLIMITAYGTIDAAVDALKRGAADFITKPFDIEEVRVAVEKTARTERLRRRSVQEDPQIGRFDLIGNTPSMQRIYSLVEKVADSPTTVLLVGESGTGKELVARALHAQSGRKNGSFIAVNCGAIPENLFESELFGYEKGAFTGAVTAKPGRMELADGGTLFLDEVGELPREMQVKLLRVLQQRAVERIGGTRTIPVDVRVVAATNVDLSAAVAAGRFREDLYYRLNVIQIRIPPLRERREDIPLLVTHFLERFNQRLSKRVRAVSAEAMSRLSNWTWPGNVRELENVIERGVLLSDSEVLDIDVLTDLSAPRPAEAEAPGGDVDLKEYVRVHTVRVERALIQQILDQEAGNVTRAARRLGISRKGLQLKMKEYGLREEDETPISVKA